MHASAHHFIFVHANQNEIDEGLRERNETTINVSTISLLSLIWCEWYYGCKYMIGWQP